MEKSLNDINYINELFNTPVEIDGKVRTLGEFKDDLVIACGAPLGMYNLGFNSDIDVTITDNKLWEALVDTYTESLDTAPSESSRIKLEYVDLFATDWDIELDHIFNPETELVDGVRVWTLDAVLQYKLHKSRPKDLPTIGLINAYKSKQL